MADESGFIEQLRQAIAAQAGNLNKTSAVELKEHWRNYQSNLNSVYSLLLKKGLLKEDPYKKDHQVAEIVAPKDSPVSDTNKVDELSVRLSEFTSLLDFINHYSSFNVDNVDLKILRNLSLVMRYIRFNDFSTASTKPTTRALAEVVDKVKKGSDNLAAGAIQSSLSQLSETLGKMEKNLKDLSRFKREEYKLNIRDGILQGLDIGSGIPNEIFTNQVKKEFQKRKPKIPYVPELIEEIFKEDYSDASSELQAKTLQALEVKKASSAAASIQQDFRPILMESLRILANSTRHIDTALERVRGNSALLQNRPKGFMEKFREWIISLSGGNDKKIIYEIEMIDPVTSMHVSKNLDYESFMASAVKKTRSLNGVLTKGSMLYQKLAHASEEQVFSFLDKSTRDVTEINKTLDALDTYFKTEVSRLERDKIRGVKNEVAAVKGNLHNASQKKYEYVALKEEQEQLKKLGIQ